MGGKILSEINAHQLKEAVSEDTVAVLVLGACENHGNHMPFGSDFIMPYELACRLASRYDRLLVLPPVPYGVSSHHKDFQMTMSLEPETMVAVIRDILESLVANRIERILIINGHDGNISPAEIAARVVKENNPKVVISCIESWWTLVGEFDKSLFDVWNGLGHGGEAETSAMLAIRPELVDMNLAPEQVVPALPDNIRIYWKFSELTTTGATGAPRRATAEKGRRIIEILENLLVSFIENMDKSNWKYGIMK
ncbi:creatininase family protein [Nitrososphaera sp.]|uniref:creatininase family protein n=1 Tax=Nitrososphaera sp. TaxID=1971748 RepID=UPI002EDBAF27